MRFLLMAPIALVAAGCAFTPQAPLPESMTASAHPDSFVGCWHGEDFQPAFQQTSAWVMHRQANGEFTVSFWSWTPSGTLTKQEEAGRWSAGQKTYTTVTTEIDRKKLDKSFVDVYDVLAFDGQQMTYFHQQMKVTFKSTRVGCDFVPPSPQRPNSSG